MAGPGGRLPGPERVDRGALAAGRRVDRGGKSTPSSAIDGRVISISGAVVGAAGGGIFGPWAPAATRPARGGQG